MPSKGYLNGPEHVSWFFPAFLRVLQSVVQKLGQVVQLTGRQLEGEDILTIVVRFRRRALLVIDQMRKSGSSTVLLRTFHVPVRVFDIVLASNAMAVSVVIVPKRLD